MNAKTILYAVGAFAGAALLVKLARGKGGIGPSGDAERLQGVADLYATNAGQQEAMRVIEANRVNAWRDLSQSTASEPTWWI